MENQTYVCFLLSLFCPYNKVIQEKMGGLSVIDIDRYLNNLNITDFMIHNVLYKDLIPPTFINMYNTIVDLLDRE